MMDTSKTLKPLNPVGILSRTFFWWLKPFFCQQKSDRIGIEDLYDVSNENTSHHLGSRLENCWNRELNQCSATKTKPSLFKVSWKTFRWPFLYHSIHVFIICVILRGFQPYVLARVIKHFETRGDKSTEDQLYYDAIALLAMILSQALVGHHSVVGRKLVGMRMSIAYSSLIYRKMLRLSIIGSNNYNSGKIMNLLSNDVEKIEDLSMFLHYIWILPVQGIIMGYFIWDNVGIASLSGIMFLVLQSIPIQGYLAKMTAKLRAKAANKTDERVRLMSEIINGIRLIKIYVWEKPFEDLIFEARRSEVNAIGKKSYLRGIGAATSVFAESTSLFLVIAACILLGKPLQASMIYSLAQYFGMMKVMMTVFYPRAMSSAAEARVSIKRIEEFLLLDEVLIGETWDVVEDNNGARGVFMKDVKVSWHGKSGDYILNRISLEFCNEKLYIVTGAVGTGKSTLLTTILGELLPIEGELKVNGRISYACQESWLFPSTVKANIIFGRAFDEERYQRVIDACELKDDLDKLPNGDLTVIGDRGSTLSGGQRARVNLARAVYKDADIYLVDDALAAVDAQVGRNLFDKCISSLLKNKIRVLITHNPEYFDKADEIIILENACVKFQGLWSNFESQENYLDEAVQSHSFSKESQIEKMNSSANINNDLTLVKSKTEEKSLDINVDQMKKIEETNYVWEYFRAGGSIFILTFLFLILILAQVSLSTCDYWLAQWIHREEIAILNHSDRTYRSALTVFASLLFVSVVTWTTSTLLFYKICMNASKNLHNRMFSRLLAAPMSFFDLNNSGKILNRFSKDTGLVDETLPTVTLDALRVILMVSGVVVQVLIISWWMLFPIVVVIVICWKFKNIYLPVAQNMRRLESEAKSPIFSHVSSTVFGLTTIRSAKMQKKMKKEFDSLQNIHTSAHHLNIVSASAFGFWLDIVSISLLALVIFGFTLVKKDDIFAGIVGLAITQILMLYGTVQYGLRQVTEMMTQMISVERIFEFTNLEQEASFQMNVSPESWVDKGEIEFDNLRLKYFDDKDAVLKNISIHINPQEKIGIIGRTGSGKTSLISALFRLYNYEGSIHIDGVDINTRGLSDLRRKISVIPQIPTLFTATVKQNLDPIDQYNNQALWQALEDVELKDRFDSLDRRMENGGNNLSTGEKQLFCLARAIVANNKIVILDEATANVDSRTDRLIRQIIDKKFSDCTILTIAHRLNTVMDSDKILLLDYGKVVGFDRPSNLAMEKMDLPLA